VNGDGTLSTQVVTMGGNTFGDAGKWLNDAKTFTKLFSKKNEDSRPRAGCAFSVRRITLPETELSPARAAGKRSMEEGKDRS